MILRNMTVTHVNVDRTVNDSLTVTVKLSDSVGFKSTQKFTFKADEPEDGWNRCVHRALERLCNACGVEYDKDTDFSDLIGLDVDEIEISTLW